MNLEDFIENKINTYAQNIIDKGDKYDQLAIGEISFYLSLRNVVKGNPTKQDIGLIDAVNDTLQALKIINADESFYKR
jgi:hypothetical protein